MRKILFALALVALQARAQSTSFSGLPSGTPISGSEWFAADQGASTVRLSPAQILAFIEANATAVPLNGTTALPLSTLFGAVYDIRSFGAILDGNSVAGCSMSASSASLACPTSSAWSGFTVADVGKLISVTGAGASGCAPFGTCTLKSMIASFVSTTGGTSTVTLNNSATTTVGYWSSTGISNTTGGSGYIPGTTETFPCSGCAQATTALLVSTQVISATINSGGSGYVLPAGQTYCKIYDASTFSGQGFVGQVTPNGSNVLAGAITILSNGFYTVGPGNNSTAPTAIAVTSNCGGTGATVNLNMGPMQANIVNAGSYASNPAPTTATDSGTGTGATWAITYKQSGTATYGTNNTAALNAAIAQVNTDDTTSAKRSCIYIPEGVMVIDASQTSLTSFASGVPGCVRGDVAGWYKSTIYAMPSESGTAATDIFACVDAWGDGAQKYADQTVNIGNLQLGCTIVGITFIGDRAGLNDQTAIHLYGRNDYSNFDIVNGQFWKGSLLKGADLSGTETQAYLREFAWGRMRCDNCGDYVLDFASTGSTITAGSGNQGILTIGTLTSGSVNPGDYLVINNSTIGGYSPQVIQVLTPNGTSGTTWNVYPYVAVSSTAINGMKAAPVYDLGALGTGTGGTPGEAISLNAYGYYGGCLKVGNNASSNLREYTFLHVRCEGAQNNGFNTGGHAVQLGTASARGLVTSTSASVTGGSPTGTMTVGGTVVGTANAGMMVTYSGCAACAKITAVSGSNWTLSAVSGNLVTLSSGAVIATNMPNAVNRIKILDSFLLNGYFGFCAALVTDPGTVALKSYDMYVSGAIDGGEQLGYGACADNGQGVQFNITNVLTTEANLRVGPTSASNGNLISVAVSGTGAGGANQGLQNVAQWTTAIDPSAASVVYMAPQCQLALQYVCEGNGWSIDLNGNATFASLSVTAGLAQTGTTSGTATPAGVIGEIADVNCGFAGAGAITISAITQASPAVITLAGQISKSNLQSAMGYGCPVNFAGTLPTGLSTGTTYYLSSPTCSGGASPNLCNSATPSFSVSTTIAGALAGTSLVGTTSAYTSGGTISPGVASPTTATWQTAAGLNLAAGNWDCSSLLQIVGSSLTTYTGVKSAIYPTAATAPAGDLYTTNNVASSSVGSPTILQQSTTEQFSNSAATPEYGNTFITYGGGTVSMDTARIRCLRTH